MGLSRTVTKSRIVARERQIRRLEAALKEEKCLFQLDRQELKPLSAVAVGPTFQETTSRSLLKAIGWRVVAGFITFGSSYYFTGKLLTALAIVGSDFASKVVTMFIGERLFNKVNIGRSATGDGVSRSVMKALIWRAIAFLNTATISGLVSGSAGIGASIASFDAIVKTSLMIAYDQMWNRIEWGKELENVDGDGI
mmetsp:Transcript_10628/g.35158  ORF Transcript_10628/g.35158 Transcript_10628/m.35158 type:complete len:196 (+) Transcript_10628:301-888(+)